MPPHYSYGRFREASYINSFSLDGVFAEDIFNFSDLSPLKSVLHRIVTSSRGTVVVLGGSETAGIDCVQRPEVVGKGCAWSARFAVWLAEVFPNASIRLLNFAQGGTTSSVILGGIGALLVGEASKADIIFVDTLVNDAHESRMWGNSGSIQVSEGSSFLAVSYEALLRSLFELCPHASVIPLLSACGPACASARVPHVAVARHYKLPVVDISHSSLPGWVTNWKKMHPPWQVHQVIADMLAILCARTWSMDSIHTLWTSQALGLPMSHQRDLDKFPTCLSPLSAYISNDPNSSRPRVISGDWKLYEDRRGKPGWISQEANSCLRFPLQFGIAPRLAVTFLRSYTNISDMSLLIAGRTIQLGSHWDDPSQHVSQSYTKFFNAETDMLQEGYQGNGVLGLDIKPNSRLDADFVLLKGVGMLKAKLISVVAC